MDEEDSLWVNHLRGRDMLEANCGNRGWGENGAICFFLGVQNHFELFFSPIELVAPLISQKSIRVLAKYLQRF
jgi:hypothetical protein